MKGGHIFDISKYRRYIFWVADLLCLVCSSLVVWLLLDWFQAVVDLTAPQLILNMALYTLLTLTTLRIAGMYKPLWRYATIRDLIGCFFGVITGASISYVVMIVLTYFQVFAQRFSLLYSLINCLVSLILILAVRIFYKSLRDYVQLCEERVEKKQKSRTLIVGAGATCRVLLTEMEMGDSLYLPVAAVDDDPAKIGCKIKHLPIYGPISLVPTICEKLNIETILVAIPSCTEEERQTIIQQCTKTNCRIRMLPFLHDLIAGRDLLTQAKPIKLEELLGRDPIRFDPKEITAFVSGKVCMVTGGGGSIGSELCRQIAANSPQQLIIVDIYENNAYEIQQELLRQYGKTLNMVVHIASVRDYAKMTKLFARYRPQILFHAAAHKHVPLMEDAPEEAVKNNIFGTFNMATLAEFYGCEKFVLISTDKAVNPTNVMGATKRCCEMIMQSMAQHHSKTEFVAVRFGNVLGSNGSVIPLFRRQIEANGPVTVTHPDIIRYFMTIPEAVSLVLQAGSMAHGGEIFVLDMGQPVKITTLAENLIRLYGYRPGVDIQIEYTGLRPGEKLFEELLMDEEGLQPTYNEKIFIGRQIEVDSQTFVRELSELKEYALANDSDGVVNKLAEIVPTFHHALNRVAKEQPAPKNIEETEEIREKAVV